MPADFYEEPLPFLTRDRVIVERSEALIACPAGFVEELRSGTWATVRYAREAQIPILLIFPNGTTKVEPGLTRDVLQVSDVVW